MRKSVLPLMFLFLVGFSAAVTLGLDSERDFYAEGDQASFSFEGAPGNYTLALERQGFEQEILDFTVNGSENKTYSRTINYTFEDGSVNSEVYAYVKNESARTLEFFLGTGEPVVTDETIKPEFVSVGEYALVNIRGIDPDLDVTGAEMSYIGPNGSVVKEMTAQSSEDPYFQFETSVWSGYNISKDFEVTVFSNSSDTVYKSGFRVYPEDWAGDSTSISAEVSGFCGVEADPFRPPGDGVVSVNGSSPFLIGWDVRNYAVNLTYNLSVTYEGNLSMLEDGKPGEMVRDYDVRRTPHPIVGGGDESMFQYNKTSRFGWYRGRLDVNGTCFTKRVSDSYYEGNDLTREEFPQWVEESVTDDDDPFFKRNFTADFKVIRPGGGSGEGDPTDNTSVPNEADQPDETGEPVEGSSPEPGVTPEPDPVPEPEPEPEPTPSLSVNIRDTQSVYEIGRGSYSPIELQISNLANTTFSDLRIDPLVERLGDGWDSRPASIENIAEDTTVNRSVFLRPSEDMETGRYSIPVLASDTNNDRDLDLQYIDVRVQKSNFSSKIEISEIPDSIDIPAGSQTSIPVLLENTGRGNISDVDIRVQNLGECGQASATNDDLALNVNSTGSVNLQLNASQNLQKCNTTVIVSTSQGAYTFSDLAVNVTPEEGFVPPEFRVPLIAILWTMGLVAYAVARRKLNLESFLVKGPFVIMVMGEVLIIIYLAVEYYSILPKGLLPF